MKTKDFLEKINKNGITPDMNPAEVELNREEAQEYLNSLRLVEKFRIQEYVAERARAYVPGWDKIRDLL